MISIVIPTYNRVASLKRCIDSIIPQFYEGLEVLVIDDRSTDDTVGYFEELKQFPFIKTIVNPENRGVNYTRNRGIDAATKAYILYLDSDDELMKESLPGILGSLKAHPSTKHFLFVVSDRADEFKNMTSTREVRYEDWVSGRFSGDFTHVVDTQTMKKYLFFEQFRMFEHLNWLRVKKETSPQLLIPLVAALRDRGRSDSLTSFSRLENVSVIKAKFESEKLFYALYHKDLSLYNPGSLAYKLLETIMLGVACYQKSDCRALVKYAGKLHIKVLGNLIMLMPSGLMQFGIIRYSGFKNTGKR